jgi:hypothetical protein
MSKNLKGIFGVGALLAGGIGGSWLYTKNSALGVRPAAKPMEAIVIKLPNGKTIPEPLPRNLPVVEDLQYLLESGKEESPIGFALFLEKTGELSAESTAMAGHVAVLANAYPALAINIANFHRLGDDKAKQEMDRDLATFKAAAVAAGAPAERVLVGAQAAKNDRTIGRMSATVSKLAPAAGTAPPATPK